MNSPTTTPQGPAGSHSPLKGGSNPDPHQHASAKHTAHGAHGQGHDDEGHAEEGEGAWLVSYADMMTLLMAFFALMFTLGQKENQSGQSSAGKSELEKMKEEVAKYFGGKVEKAYDEVKQALDKYIRENGLEAKIQLKQTSSSLSVTFIGSAFFEDGTTKIRPEMLPVVEKMSESLAKEVKDIPVYVEGHTDNRPIATNFYPSNWELSSARAATIVRMLQSKGMDPKRLMVQGFGDTQPLAPNQDEKGNPIPENQSKNRRIVIHMIKL